MMIIDSCIPFSDSLEPVNKIQVQSIPIKIPPFASFQNKNPVLTNPTINYGYNKKIDDDHMDDYYDDYDDNDIVDDLTGFYDD